MRRITDRNIWVVYGVILLVGIAYGLSTAVVSLHLDHLHYDKHEIGWLAAAFATGIVLGSLPAGIIVRALSPKRALVVALLGYAVCVSLFPRCETTTGIALVRACDGAFSVVVWVAAETELLGRASKSHKAFVMSLYAICLAVGYVVGPLSARALIGVFPMARVFQVAGGFAVLSALAAQLFLAPRTTVAEAAAHAPSTYGTLQILRRIRTSCFATFAYGYFQISVVALLPLYLVKEKGIPEERTILLTALFAFGMLVFSSFAGRLGDRFGHLPVMRVLAFVGLLMVASFVLLDAFPLMGVAVTIAGATLASISPVSLALQGHAVPAAELHRANALYNTFYAAGMLLGPPISGYIFRHRGGGAMLLHLAALWALFVVFTFVFARDHRRAGAPRENGTLTEA
jgi:MFS family permease